jgi:hypothetical protein
MLSTTRKHWPRPLAQVTERIQNNPRSTISIAASAAVIVAVGVWIWPDLKRTIRIHRM